MNHHFKYKGMWEGVKGGRAAAATSRLLVT